jgi:predicted Fe-Mo cluster-binding NifX family protein
MLIAVTSKDGLEINQHFGHAARFLVYEVGSSAPLPVGEVAADAYCNWGSIHPDMSPEQFNEAVLKMQECADAPPAHRMMPEKLAAIATALGDCRVIVTAMIGEAPQAELERLGFTIYTVSGPIDKVLTELSKAL